jgi:hypothetical protein
MTPALSDEVNQLHLLMSAVDAALAAGTFALAEDLDALLESRLDDLDHRLSGLDEGGDVLDADNHIGVEDQFRDAWSQYLAGIGSFGLPGQEAELAAHLREILREEAFHGPYSPQPFLDLARDEDLLELAADLWNDRQALILGTR